MMERHKALLDKYPEPESADGGRLKKCREDLKIGQVELSKLAGISQVAISRIELGVRPFSKRARNKIWPVIENLYEEQVEALKARVEELKIEQEAEVKKGGQQVSYNTLRIDKDTTSESLAVRFKPLSFVSIPERLQFENTLLTTEISYLKQQLEGKDAQITTLIKALDAAMREAVAKVSEGEETARAVGRLRREESGN